MRRIAPRLTAAGQRYSNSSRNKASGNGTQVAPAVAFSAKRPSVLGVCASTRPVTRNRSSAAALDETPSATDTTIASAARLLSAPRRPRSRRDGARCPRAARAGRRSRLPTWRSNPRSQQAPRHWHRVRCTWCRAARRWLTPNPAHSDWHLRDSPSGGSARRRPVHRWCCCSNPASAPRCSAACCYRSRHRSGRGSGTGWGPKQRSRRPDYRPRRRCRYRPCYSARARARSSALRRCHCGAPATKAAPACGRIAASSAFAALASPASSSAAARRRRTSRITECVAGA